MEKRIILKSPIKQIVLIGSESVGKTSLASYLAAEYNTEFLPEYARGYIEGLDRTYTYDDVVHIAKKQIELENEILEKENEILFLDTDMIITKVWFQEVFGKVPTFVENHIRNHTKDFYLLLDNELPWIRDAVRENGGENRTKLFRIYKKELEKYNFKYEIIQGQGRDRYIQAKRIVEKLNR